MSSVEFWQSYPLAWQQPNNDEVSYPDRRGNFSKGLPHNCLGLVEPEAYQRLIQALTSGDRCDFESIPPAQPVSMGRKFVNPQAGLASELIGPDPEHLAMSPAPTFSSIASAAEITENYWMALLRDLHFADFAFSPLIEEAIADLEQVHASDGTTLRKVLLGDDPVAVGQALTAQTILRGSFEGERAGPYLSQFLLQDCFFGSQQIDSRMHTVKAGSDYATNYTVWLEMQRGLQQEAARFDGTTRFIRNGRDLGQWVQRGQIFQAYQLACLQLLESKAELNETHPYRTISNQAGFATFGRAHILSLVSEVATRALKAVYYQKWAVHRRLRPEAYAGRIHVKFIGAANGQTKNFCVHPALEETHAITRIYRNYGSLLLPVAFPNGAPLDPSYGSAHATVAGACTTLLKAWFDGSQKFHSLRHALSGKALMALQASPDGRMRCSYVGDDMYGLSVEGELNKLAGNIALAGSFAGIHWRSDARNSLLLGEKMAIGSLMDYAGSFNEPDVRFRFHSFTGKQVEVGDHQVWVDGVAMIQQAYSFSDELAILDD